MTDDGIFAADVHHTGKGEDMGHGLLRFDGFSGAFSFMKSKSSGFFQCV